VVEAESYTLDGAAAAVCGGELVIALDGRTEDTRVCVGIHWIVLEKCDGANDRIHRNYIALVKGNTRCDRRRGQSNVIADETP